ncbi:hypothetical protein ES707_12761 [subsurface metagenome]
MPFTVGQYLTANDLKSQEDAHTLGYGVVNGLKVVPTDPASMVVQVETGKAYVADTLVEKGAVTDLTVGAADPTNPRKDIVVCNSAGTLSIVAGTPEAALPNGNVGVYTLNPEPPSIPANSIILGEIWVPAGATSITGSEIYDKRVSIADFLTHKGDASAHHAKYTNAEAIAAAKTDTALKNPSGMIILWHGTIANIPSGWVLCDGNNSTPNLLTRFVEGVATAATNPGATGGETSKSHISHKHTMPSHYHTMPSHYHTVGRTQVRQGTGSYMYVGKGLDTSSDDPGDTNPKDPGDTNSTTVSSHSDIRPLYYDVAFLMKT